MILVDDEAVDRVYKSALTKIGLDHPIGQLSLPFLPQQVPPNNVPYIELLILLDIVRDGYLLTVTVTVKVMQHPLLLMQMRSYNYFYQSGGFLSKSSPHYMILQGMIGQLNNHKVNHLHNLQTITMGIIQPSP